MFSMSPFNETHPKLTQKMENSFEQVWRLNFLLYEIFIKDGIFKFISPVWPTPKKRLVLNIVKPISWCHWQKWYDQGWTFWREKCPSNFPKSIWRICLLKNPLTLQWLRNDQNVSKNTKNFSFVSLKYRATLWFYPSFQNNKSFFLFSKLTFFPRPDIFVLEFWIEKHSNYVSRNEKLKSTSFH